jgi:hypothetical protein
MDGGRRNGRKTYIFGRSATIFGGVYRAGTGVAFSETPCYQAATASQPSAFRMSPAATARANASVILASVRSFLRISEVSARTPGDLEPRSGQATAPGAPGAVASRESERYLNRLSMIRMKPGPMMTTNSAGRMHRISGNTILTGVCCAFASAA